MEQAFEAARGGNNWLQDFARAEEERNDCAKPDRVIGAARRPVRFGLHGCGR